MRRTLQNLAGVLSGEMLLKAANFAALVVVARLYGAATVGQIAAALAIAGVVFMFAGSGIQTSAIVETAERAGALAEWVSRLWWTTSLLLVPLAIGIVVAGPRLSAGLPEGTITALVTLRTLLQFFGQVQISALKSLDRMKVIGQSQMAHGALLVAWLGAAYRFHWNVDWLLAGLVAAQLFELFLTGAALVKMGARLQRVRIPECLHLARRTALLGMSQALANIVMRLDVLVLSFLATSTEVGEFAAAHSLLVLGYVVSWVFGTVVLPEMIRLAKTPDALGQYLGRWTGLLALAGAIFAAVAFWAVPSLLPALLGPGFAASGRLASVLLLAIPLVLLNALYANYAIARGWILMGLRVQVAVVFLALALNIALGLKFSAWGIVAAVLIREAFLLTLLRFGGARLALQPRTVST